MVLQVIPQISISGGQPAILLPLLFVLFVSAVKDIFEDSKRHKSDSQENNSKTELFNKTSGKFEEARWKDI